MNLLCLTRAVYSVDKRHCVGSCGFGCVRGSISSQALWRKGDYVVSAAHITSFSHPYAFLLSCVDCSTMIQSIVPHHTSAQDFTINEVLV